MNKKNDLLSKVREIEIKAETLSTSILMGKHRSRFHGNGMDFKDLREYTPSDDIRHIAWSQSARSHRTYVKTFEEEREIPFILALDRSHSLFFGSSKHSNRETALELAATLALSAIKNGDRVGLALFTDQLEHYLPPRKGKEHVSRIIRDLLEFKVQSRKSSAHRFLRKLPNLIPSHSHIILLTDIHSPLEIRDLTLLSKQYETSVLTIFDPYEQEWKMRGTFEIFDLESQETLIIRVDKRFQKKYQETMDQMFQKRSEFLNRNGIHNRMISNRSDIFMELIRFYQLRRG